GNVMIDSLVAALPAASAFGAPARHRVAERSYVVVTLHRPCNVDDAATLRELLEALVLLGKTAPVLFPVHPRTRARIAALGMPGLNGGLQRSEEHTSELQSRRDLVCRLLLEKKSSKSP